MDIKRPLSPEDKKRTFFIDWEPDPTFTWAAVLFLSGVFVLGICTGLFIAFFLT